MVEGEGNQGNRRGSKKISLVGRWMGEVLCDDILTIKCEEVRYETENSGFDVVGAGGWVW